MSLSPRHELRINIIASRVEDLKIRISNARVPQDLENIKETLLSILSTFKPDGEEEDAIFSFLERVVESSMKTLILFEMMDNGTPRIAPERLHQVLKDVKKFIASTNQWKSYPCSLADLINLKSSELEQRLEAISGNLKASFPSSSVETKNPFAPSSSRRNDSMRILPNANDFTMNDAKFFSANGSIYLLGGGIAYSERRKGPLESLNLDTPYTGRDLLLEKELHVGKDYRLHRGKARGKVVMVKVFEGRYAEQLCSKTMELNRGVMHPNLLRAFGEANHDSEAGPMPSFLLFDSDCKGTVERELPLALMDGVRTTWIIGVNTVIGCTRALLYLENIGFPLPLMRPEQFVPLVSKEGKVVISLDADTTSDVAIFDNDDTLQTVRTSGVIQICNDLIQRTFYASCQKFYPSQRVYDDEENQDETSGLEDEAADYLNVTESGEGSMSGIKPTTEKFLPKSEGHRRELIWKYQDTSSYQTSSSSLEEIAQNYETSLARFRSKTALAYRPGYPTTYVAHRCPGYKRTEIILSPNIDQSGIVSHTSPVPNEICLVCGERVEETDIFDCRCGPWNDKMDVLRPTIKCTICRRWQHQDCMGVTTNARMQNYECGRCSHQNFLRPSGDVRRKTVCVRRASGNVGPASVHVPIGGDAISTSGDARPTPGDARPNSGGVRPTSVRVPIDGEAQPTSVRVPINGEARSTSECVPIGGDARPASGDPGQTGGDVRRTITAKADRTKNPTLNKGEKEKEQSKPRGPGFFSRLFRRA